MTERAAIVAARRKRLADWIRDRHEGNQSAFVQATGENQGMVSGLLRSKSFGEALASRLERSARMPRGYLVSPLTPAAAPEAPPSLVERVADAEGELAAFKALTGTVLEAISAALPDAGRAIAEQLRAAMADAPHSQRLVLETAVLAVEGGLQASVRASRQAGPSGSARKPQSTRR